MKHEELTALEARVTREIEYAKKMAQDARVGSSGTDSSDSWADGHASAWTSIAGRMEGLLRFIKDQKVER